MISPGIAHSAPNHFTHVRPNSICSDTHAHPHVLTATHTPVNTAQSKGTHIWRQSYTLLHTNTLEGCESTSHRRCAAAVDVGLWATAGGEEWCYLKNKTDWLEAKRGKGSRGEEQSDRTQAAKKDDFCASARKTEKVWNTVREKEVKFTPMKERKSRECVKESTWLSTWHCSLLISSQNLCRQF